MQLEIASKRVHASFKTFFAVVYHTKRQLFLPSQVLSQVMGCISDGILIHNSSELSCHASGFAPWSLHSFRVRSLHGQRLRSGPTE